MTTSRARSILLCLASVCGVLAFSGCATYRLGSMLPPGIKSVYVPTFVNETKEPFIEADTTRATIRELQMDGSLKVAPNAESADSELKVTLTGYDLSPLTYSDARRTAAVEYRLVITARIVLTERATDKVLAQNSAVRGESTFTISGDFTTSKTLAMPATATDLARRIVEAVVENW